MPKSIPRSVAVSTRLSKNFDQLERERLVLRKATDDNLTHLVRITSEDGALLRSNIPTYSLVGFACATSADSAVILTLGLVTSSPHPESRPIRVLMSREACRDLVGSLERRPETPVAQVGRCSKHPKDTVSPMCSAHSQSRWRGQRLRNALRLIHGGRPA
jgi:hypothetical protein